MRKTAENSRFCADISFEAGLIPLELPLLFCVFVVFPFLLKFFDRLEKRRPMGVFFYRIYAAGIAAGSRHDPAAYQFSAMWLAMRCMMRSSATRF